jgi:hypothetical protein
MESKIVAVSREAHKNTKIRTDLGYPHAQNTHLCTVSLREMDNVIANYPVTFVKQPEDNSFRAVAIFGFSEGENVFALNVQGRHSWNATYVPQIIQRYPFSIGIDKETEVLDENLPLCIDEASPLVNTESGEALLTDKGEPTEYMLKIQQLLADLYQGEGETNACIEQLDKAGVLVELAMVFTLQSGKTHTINGLHAADRNKLMALSVEDTAALNKTGALMLAYLASTSLSQITRLIQLKNINAPDPILSVKVEYPGLENAEPPKA